MLLGLFLHWVIKDHSRKYSSMETGQTIAYISDIGADKLKPLFVSGCVVTTITFDLSFAAERWLRHSGRLVPNMSTGEKILFGLSIAWAFVGTAGLILLSIFDTVNHPKLHDVFLLLFIGGYMLSAVFICWEAQRLGSSESHLCRYPSAARFYTGEICNPSLGYMIKKLSALTQSQKIANFVPSVFRFGLSLHSSWLSLASLLHLAF